MKSVVFVAPGEVRICDVVKPQLVEPYGVLLEPILVSPCSSDAHTVYGGGMPKQNPHILGHECVAKVIATASGVCDFRVGDIVAVPAITPDWRAESIQEGNDRHAEEHFSGHRLGRTWPGVFAESFSIPDADTTLAKIPEGVTLEQALMSVDVMTTGFTAAEYANIKVGDTVCVMGIGPIGLMAVAAAMHLGAARIIAVGTRPECVRLAYQYGANEVLSYKDGDVVEQILDKTSGIGPDSVIVAGGGDEVFSQAIDMVRYGIGTVSNVNYYGGAGNLLFPKFSGGRGMAGKTIHTELAKGGRMRIERMLKMISYGRIDPSPLVTHRLDGWNGILKGLDMMNNKGRDVIKIAVSLNKV
jgi:threonine dehydrogenase-like Zn-dependent dehydrogenase